MNSADSSVQPAKRKGPTGWTLLWPWVIGLFLILIAAWWWLITTSLENMPETVPVKRTEGAARHE